MGNNKEEYENNTKDLPQLDIELGKENRAPDIQAKPVNDSDSEPVDDPVSMYKQKIKSIPHITATEERDLNKKKLIWQHIKSLSNVKCDIDDFNRSSLKILLNALKEIINDYILVGLLKKHSGLNELGDIYIEDTGKNVSDIDVIRLILKHSQQKQRDNSTLQTDSQGSDKLCCFGDLFGYLFREALHNIAFGKGNTPLVNKITKEANCRHIDIKEKLTYLAINVGLLPINMIKIIAKNTQLDKLGDIIRKPGVLNSLGNLQSDFKRCIASINADGKAALRRLVESHLWQVLGIAQHYENRGIAIDIDDLIQEGSIGLIKAAEKFDPILGKRFMSYAHYWVRQTIIRAIVDKDRVIRLPVHIRERIKEFQEVIQRLEQEYGREPTPEEVGESIGVSSKESRLIVNIIHPPISLEQSMSNENEEEGWIIDSLENHSAISPSDATSSQLLKEKIEEVLSTLTPREQRVLTLRFGLEDGRSRTLEEVGREFDVTRERIRQIEAKAIRKLRHPSRSSKLRNLLE